MLCFPSLYSFFHLLMLVFCLSPAMIRNMTIHFEYPYTFVSVL